MNRIKSIIVKAVAGVLALYVLWLGFEWSAMRVYVGQDEALVITSKFGSALPAGLVVAPEGSHYKGVQQGVLGPGRYFFDPVEYEWQVVKQVEVAAGDPDKWEWDEEGNLKDPATAPMVALISLKQSLKPGSAPEGSVVVPD